MVRAKMKVKSVSRDWDHGPLIVRLAPEYDEKVPEDIRFSKATPMSSGDQQTEVTMIIDNPVAAAQMGLLDRYFYVDFTEIQSDETVVE